MSTKPTTSTSPIRRPVTPPAAEQALAEAVDAAERYGARVNIRFADGATAAAIRMEFGDWPEFVANVARGIGPRKTGWFYTHYSRQDAAATSPPGRLTCRFACGRPGDPTIVIPCRRPHRHSGTLDPAELRERIEKVQTSR